MDLKKAYKAPHAKLVEVYVQGVVCQSTDTGAVSIDGYTEEKLDW